MKQLLINIEIEVNNKNISLQILNEKKLLKTKLFNIVINSKL